MISVGGYLNVRPTNISPIYLFKSGSTFENEFKLYVLSVVKIRTLRTYVKKPRKKHFNYILKRAKCNK